MSGHCHLALLVISLTSLGMADDAIQCPPCSQEKLIRCLGPTGCLELVREPGCGCCATCALQKGEPCGVYTARCGSGLRCYPTKNSEKPLHTLMHGQGVCTEIEEIEAIQATFQTADDDHPNISLNPCPTNDKTCQQKEHAKLNWNAMQRMKKHSLGRQTTNNQPAKMGSCHKALNVALERLASLRTKTQEDFLNTPIPNCDREGNYNPKQCHPALDGQRGKCWCVDRNNGSKLNVPYDPNQDPDCQLTSELIRK
ncbi:insulin-like growth factor-binding protein 4 isoform X2 [Pseudophryne corroboree]|uniref:insulin-like growth factor-binding protein 4 isoform X2 n=1 Tax=Pseudophryne corroboree TaxID=495146 RepID=UPI003081ACFA